jgi:hypothetical protein
MANRERLVSVPAARAYIEANVGDPILKGCMNNVLDGLSAVDAVGVVRCKDCKRCFKHTTKRNKQNMWLCMRNEMEVCVRPDDFCSYGERRCDNG